MERIKRIRKRIPERGLGILLTLIGLLFVALGSWIIYDPSMSNIELLGGGAVVLGLFLLIPGSLLLT